MTRKILCLFIVSMLVISGNLFALDFPDIRDIRELRIGSFVSGNLDPGQELWYSVRTTESGILTVETAGSTDTFLEVFDARRNFIMENDDGGEGLNARIEIVVTFDTTYLFRLRGFDADESGSFRILANKRPMPHITELRIDSTYSGRFARGEENWFSVRPTDDGLLIVETMGIVNTFLAAYDDNWNYLTEDGDSGQGSNARIEIPVAADRVYYFQLRGFSPASFGSYRILASLVTLMDAADLPLGSFLSGNLSGGGNYWFNVRTAESGRLVVETTGNIDTFLIAYTASFELIDWDDDSGEGLNARIEIPVEADRIYIFRLRGFARGTRGPYRIFAGME